MSDEEGEPRWYLGDSTRTIVRQLLEETEEGTYCVFNPTDERGKLILAFKAYEEVESKEIVFQGGLYGFTEPLQFESVEEALETFNNNSQSRFYQLLKEPLQPEPTERTERTRSRKLSTCRSLKEIDLLKHLRSTSKLRTEKDEEKCALQEDIRQLSEELQKLTNHGEALGGVIRTLEKQIQKHKSLEAGVLKSSRTDAQELSENYEKLASRLAQVQQEVARTAEEVSLVEGRKSHLLRHNYNCRSQVETLEAELVSTRSDIERLHPQYTVFADRLLADDTSCSTAAHVTVTSISKNEAEHKLRDRDEGSFLIWHSHRADKPYYISIAFEDRVIHFPILHIDGYYGFDETTCIFENLADLVANYGRIPFSAHDDRYGDLTLRYQCTS